MRRSNATRAAADDTRVDPQSPTVACGIPHMSGHSEPKLLQNAFISSPLSTRWASSTPLTSTSTLKISRRRPLTSSQKLDIRPVTDWTWLMSGQSGSPARLVQRPWPEYVPESSAAVGRKWDGYNLSALDEGPQSPLRKMPRSPFARKLEPLATTPQMIR